MFSPDYVNLVTANYREQAAELAKTDSIERDIAFLKTVGSITNETIKNSLLYENAKYSVTYTEDLATFYNTFMAASTNEDNNKEITESYNKLKTVGGTGGLISVDKDGNISMPFNTPGMFRGFLKSTGEKAILIYKD